MSARCSPEMNDEKQAQTNSHFFYIHFGMFALFATAKLPWQSEQPRFNMLFLISMQCVAMGKYA